MIFTFKNIIRKRTGWKKYLLLFLFGFIYFNADSQNVSVLKIADENGVALPGVSLSFNSQQFVTNDKGEVSIGTTKAVTALLSAVGYENQVILISPSENKSITMHRLSQSLQQVVITGQMNDTKQQESVENITVIDAKTIQELQVNNLQDLMALQLNVRIVEDPILGSTLTFDGQSGANVKVMIDGVPVIGRQNDNLDLSQILLNNIDRVEIIEGSMSVLYSTDASGGVINLITKKESPYKYSIQLNNTYESPGSFNTSGLFMEQFANSHLSIYGGRYYFDGYPKFDSSRVQDWKPYINYFGGVSYGFTKGNYTAEIKTDLFTQTILNRGAPVITPYEAYAFDQRYITDRYNGAFFQKWKLNNKTEINTTVAYDYYSNYVRTYYKDLTTLQEEPVSGSGDADTTIFHHILVRALYINSKPESRLNFQTGFEGNYELALGNELLYKVQHTLELAAFMVAEWKIKNNLILKPGIRFNYISNFNSPVIPSANLKWDINQSATFRFSVSRGYRAPELKELDLDFVDVDHNIHGNPDLKAETSFNTNTSINYHFKMEDGINISLQPTFFYSYIHNQIILALIDTASNYYLYSNVQTTEDYGGTITTVISGKYLSFTAAYGLTAVNSYGPGISPNTTWSPEFDSRIVGRLPRSRTSISITYKNVGISPAYVTDGTGALTKYETDGYTLMDAIISQPLMNGFIILSAGVKNIFNVDNIASTLPNTTPHSDNGDILVAPGRYFIASVQFNIHVKKKEDTK